MKRSNIILISAVASISFLIIAGSLQLRFTGKKKFPFTETNSRTIELASFRHLMVRDVPNLTIITDSESKIDIKYALDSRTPKVHYRVSGDTLYIDSVQTETSMHWLTLHISSDLKAIGGTNTGLQITGYSGESLKIDLDDSRLRIQPRQPLHLSKLTFRGTNQASMHVSNVTLDTAIINLAASSATFRGKVGNVEGALTDASKLSARGALKIDLRRDSTSHWLN